MNGNLQVTNSIYSGGYQVLTTQSNLAGTYASLTGATFTGDVSMNNRLYVASDVSLNKRVQVGGDVSMNGNVQIGGNLIIGVSTIPQSAIIGGVGSSSSNFTTDVSMSYRLYIASDVSMNRRLNVGADASFNGNVQIIGNLTATYPANSIPSSAIIGGVSSGGGGSGFTTDVSYGNIQVANNIGIGTPISSSYALDVSGPVRSNNQFTGTAFSATSDYRIKASPLSLFDTSINKLFTVNDLNPVYYYNTITKKPDVGFIAHELQQHLPFLVDGVKDGHEYQTINYLGLTAILVKEIQEMKKRITDLEERVK